jgi:two-component system, NtrC family, sensor kinase
VTNAFQACASSSNPTVSITTKCSPVGTSASLRLSHRDTCEIQVHDNGPGIPDHIKDKIFQPFFTTKPTGQGTGLGLSLAYDIIKAHGGEIKAESKEGAGTRFIIELKVISE